MTLRGSVVSALLVLFIASSAMSADRGFTILNTSAAARDEHLGVSIPFNPGQVKDPAALNRLVIEGRPTAWRILTRYPDGSVMIARAQARFALKPGEKLAGRIVAGEAASAVKQAAPPDDHSGITLLWTDPGGVVRKAQAVRDAVLEQTPFRRVVRYRGVITDEQGKEPLGLTVIKETWAGADRGYLDLMVASDSLRAPLPVVKFKELAIEADGMRLVPLWPQKESGLTVAATERGTRVVLMRNDYIGDNTGKAYRFAWGRPGDDYLKVMAADPLYPLATPETFKAFESAVGVLGYVPSLPAGVTSARAWDYLDRIWRNEYAAKKGPWDHLGHACMKGSGATGDQADFGVLALFRTYQSGHPGELLNVMPAMFRESCRMNHFYGLDAKVLLPQKVVFWTERVNERVWREGFLGRGQKHWDVIYRGHFDHGWTGYDEEHISLNNLYEAWTLTGDHLLHGELTLHYHQIALCYLNHFWVSHGVSNRALGRMAHAALLATRAVGDDWLIEKFDEKVRRFVVPPFKQNQRDFGEHDVAAFALWRDMRDKRVANFVDGKAITTNDVVSNWQEGLIVWAVGQLPDQTARDLAYESGKCMCLVGFNFADNVPKTYYAAADPSRFKQGGIGLSWYYPSMRWAATEAARRKDPDAAKMKQAADAVLAAIRRGGLEGGVFAGYQRWTAIPTE